MLGFAVRKRIDQDKLANIFVNSLIEVVENGFRDIEEMIQDDTAFVVEPIISESARNQFLLIVAVGNLEFLRESFDSYEVDEIEDSIIEKFASIYDMEKNDFARLLGK